MVGLGERVVAVELTIAWRASDLRGPRALGAGTRRAHERVRELVPFTDAGRALPPDLEPIVELIRSDALRE
jgi:histidine ammonia-lyase